jgi:multiple sugar transport system substrate-binding protein
MNKLSRRSLLRASLGLAAAGTLARPYIANAAVTTITVWWTQGFIPEEDAAFRKMVADYQKQSGNTIDYSIVPFGPLGYRVISALTSGDVPDLIAYDAADATVIPQNAWHDKIVDVTDVIETQKSEYLPNALLGSRFYNNVTKQRGYYQVPYKTEVVPFHVWKPLVEKAGDKLSDAPKTWDAFWAFFEPMQKKLRQSTPGLYALGMQLTTTGPTDGNNLFYAFLVANGGKDLITPDGQAHLDDPAIKEAVIKALTFMTNAYKEGYVPPGVLSWSDVDDNNAFHAREIIVDFDGTLSTEVALYHDKKAYYDEIATLGLPLTNGGKQNSAFIAALGGFIPKGAKNVAGAKEFMKYVIQPKVMNAYLKEGLGRWLPAFPSLVKSDPFWLDPHDPHRPVYVREGLLDPTIVNYYVSNPGIGVVNAQQIWGAAETDIIRNGMTPQQATENAFKKIEAILAQYPIRQV